MIYLDFEAIQFKPTCKTEDIAKLKELLLTLQVLPQNASFSHTEGFDVRNPLASWLGTTYENFGTIR